MIISVRPEREFWPEPDRHLPKLAGFLTGFDTISSVVPSKTI